MSPDDTDKKPDSENDKGKEKAELIMPDKGLSELSKRMGGDATTDAPAPLMKEDKVSAKEDIKNESKEDNKQATKEVSKTDNKENNKEDNKERKDD